MIATLAGGSSLFTLATPRRARRALVLVHLPMITYLTAVCWTGLGVYPDDPHRALDVTFALALGAVHLVLSLRVAGGHAGGERYPLWALVLTLAVVPAALHADLRWLAAAWFAASAGGMTFTGRPRAVAFGAPLVAAVVQVARLSVESGPYLAYYIGYTCTIFALGAVCLLAATRVVQVATELSESQAELADLAGRDERRRAGRDLHDTLGQRLSAVSVKGDLASALWAIRPDAAAREIAELSAIAVLAQRDLEEVAHDELTVTLDGEVARATALLRSAGVSVQVHDARPRLPEEVDRLLGWAIRESTTNLLRHSTAATCRIRTSAGGPGVLLEVVNDGAGPPSGRLGGLAGLAERARAVDGLVAASRVGRDGFRVQVAVPLEVP